MTSQDNTDESDRTEAVPWRQYQDEAAAVFQDLGFETTVNATVQGLRNDHDVDVLATYEHAGLTLTWVVECKKWKARVGKDRVLVLRAIVEDVGADRGIIVSETGFQSGALTATRKSSVVATSLRALRVHAADELLRRRLESFPERIAQAHNRYWSMSKSKREDAGLRPEGPSMGYSGGSILDFLPSLLISGLAGDLPPRLSLGPTLQLTTKEVAADVMDLLLDDLERRLDQVEQQLDTVVRPPEPCHLRLPQEGDIKALNADDAALVRTLSQLLYLPIDEVARRLRLPRETVPAKALASTPPAQVS